MRALLLGVLAGGVLLPACGHPTESHTDRSTRFASPLIGRPMAELFYGAYLDQGSRDYHCGAKYYAGHRGTDILLRNFRVQDSGVTVVAAAPGRVAVVHDGEPDRNSFLNSANVWNAVHILHDDGITSVYGHLRRGSILVSAGQEVATGTPLGLVGSSGYSNWPHLHFEVRSGARTIDPWSGDCQIGGSLWENQLPYQNAFKVIDAGVQDRRILGQAELLERAPDPPVISGATGVMSFWIELYNVRAELLRAELRDPAGQLVQQADYANFLTFSTAFALATYPVTAGLPAGRWKAVFLMSPLGGTGTPVKVAEVEFLMQPPAAGSAAPALLARARLELLAPGGDSP